MRHTFNEWLRSIHRSAAKESLQGDVNGGKNPIRILQPLNVDNSVEHIAKHLEYDYESVKSGHDAMENGEEDKDLVKINMEDVQDEVDFWSSSIICCVVGANNPSAQVMEGYFRKFGGFFKVDKVAMVKRGVFLVRFPAIDSRDKVLQGHYFFYKNPLIMKPWSEKVDFDEYVKTIPVWVHLRLPLKYWSEQYFHKIISKLGDPIKRDEATRNMDKLQFARILVEMKMEQLFPNNLYFLNEYGEKTRVEVEYEWKSLKCTKCGNMGHESSVCRVRIVK